MKSVLILIAIVVSTSMSLAFAEDHNAIQQQLDQACETTRLEKLRSIREKYATPCVAKGDRSQEYFDRFYGDYVNADGNQRMLFYDLSECEKAGIYRRSYRSVD